MEQLLSPLQTPTLQLPNRVVMAPMSRRRGKLGVMSDTAPLYYAQRAGAGLIIAENSAVAINGIGYLGAPGIYNKAQQAAWKKIVDAVHDAGGRIFIQLVHGGRVGHHFNHETHAKLVGPSAVQPSGSIRVPDGSHLPNPVPEALTAAGAQAMIDAHINAARTAIDLGFDGIEIHGAHGFLPDQFLNPHVNLRNDQYGGSIARRSRFLLDIMEGVSAAIGARRTGVRLSPFATYNDMRPYAEEAETHRYITDALQRLDILYIHLSHQAERIPDGHVQDVRRRFDNLLIQAGGFTADNAEATLQAGLADLIAFGRPFISNPDLVERFRHGADLTPWNEDTFYQGGDVGYIDYPALQCC